jgi:hypothetical protein
MRAVKERLPSNIFEGELKRGEAPLTISSPSPLGKGIQGMGPLLPDSACEEYKSIRLPLLR